MLTTPPNDANPPPTLARLIHQARQKRDLTETQLADPDFTTNYVAAIERGAISPSRPALEFIALRLQANLAELLTAPQELANTVDLQAVAEDLRYQANCALKSIRAGRVDEGLNMVAEAEDYALPYLPDLPIDVRCLVPFLRGRAYYQRVDFLRAQMQLELALNIAEDDEPSMVAICNLLGAVLYQLEQPALALTQHRRCLAAIHGGAIKDLNLRLSVHQNLALDYTALKDPPQAIDAYHDALLVLRDLDDKENRARIYWGLLMAQRTVGAAAQSLLNGMRALQIYEELDRPTYAASVALNMAEILLDESRFAEAEEMLKKVKWYLIREEHIGLLSFLYGDLAELALRRGQLEQAVGYAEQCITYAEANRQIAAGAARQPITHPTRAYAEALQTLALVEEARGHRDEVDQLFKQAIAQIDQTAFDESIFAIRLSYADLLCARGAFELSIEHYRILAQLRPRSRL